ncbi:MAG: bifunctional 4-hydroxy-2-oxoglutarate aldolase/2-dehydro-3-deoxy-phosphogluconate aldolase [Clostridia bacterium]
MNEILKQIGDIGIVPIMQLDSADDAVPLAKALNDGGIPLMEIMFRTPAAEESIKRISKEMPDFLVGAGTILSVEQAQKAIDAGAQFIVSPGFNPKVVKFCIDNNIPITPGCVTPTEIEAAIEMGIDVVKFFPAVQTGGVAAMNELSGPYPGVKFIATGGLTAETMCEYIKFDKLLAAGGGFMVEQSFIKNKEYDKVTELVAEVLHAMLGFEVGHVGINCTEDSQAKQLSKQLADLFSFPVSEFPKSYFPGKLFEVMKNPYFGVKGHISILTNDVPRAYAYFKRKGVPFREETAAYNKNGKLSVIYFEEEYGGFALHLAQK